MVISKSIPFVDREGPGSSDLPLLIGVRTLAQLTERSIRSLLRDNAAGRLPRPVKLGRSVRWRRDEVVRWIEVGCPSRREWEASYAQELTPARAAWNR
jgi:predicted DNA-binding transcriptional regulator AlpA